MSQSRSPSRGETLRNTPHTRNGSFPLRQQSISSESSASSQILLTHPAPFARNPQATNSQTSLVSSTIRQSTKQNDLPFRNVSPMLPPPNFSRDRPRQHSQGFFEPTLPTAANAGLSASQIAAQAAMGPRHDRRRSQILHDASPSPDPDARRRPTHPAPIQTNYADLSRGLDTPGTRSAATTAANVAFPRSPLTSPPVIGQAEYMSSPVSDRESSRPSKEKSRRKLFSKPNKIYTSKDKDPDKRPAPSPKMGIYSSSTLPINYQQSTTSLADSIASTATTIYANPNASTSTLVPSDRATTGEKEKHKHHFLSRQKNKLKDTADHHNFQLSSASSNSRPADPTAPQSLYSFMPSSPAPTTKSFSGLDLRHGGRALRGKKKEEKSSFMPPRPGTAGGDREYATAQDWPITADVAAASVFGPASTGASTVSGLGISTQGLGGFGLHEMSADDAWPLLKARLLNIFEGEDLRTPIEDFNRLVTAHIQRCSQHRAPYTVIEDLRDLLNTGFNSIDKALRNVSDERIVPHLVETWAYVFGTVLPFMQAVFLPLDLELRRTPTSSQIVDNSNVPLDTRTLTLLTFRDIVIIPRHDTLLTIFSRLSLDSIHATPIDFDSPRPDTAASTNSTSGILDPSIQSFNSQTSTLLDSGTSSDLGARSRATSNTSAGSFASMESARRQGTLRPGTAGGISTPNVFSHGGRIATPGPQDSAKVTETAARMLQCVSVLAGVRTGESEAIGAATHEGPEMIARRKMERLAKELKLNWLGRGRTGRNRRGFVGSKLKLPVTVGVAA